MKIEEEVGICEWKGNFRAIYMFLKVQKSTFWFSMCVCRFVDAEHESMDANSIVMQMNDKISVVCFQTIYWLT